MEQASGCALVTGGRGFIGRQVVAALRRAGYRTVTVGPARAGDGVDHRPISGPEDSQGLTRILRECRPDLVVHLAAAPPPAAAEDHQRVTVEGTRRLLMSLAASEFRPLLLAIGSAAEFGATLPGEGLVADDHPCAPATPYGQAKHEATRLVLRYRAEGGRCSVLRLFTAAGPEPPPHSLLGNLAAQLRSLPPTGGAVQVHGPDRARDYLSVTAIADTVVALAERGEALPPIMNLCSGQGVTVREWVDALASVRGIHVQVEPPHHGLRRAEPQRVIGHPGILLRLGIRPDTLRLPQIATAIMAP